MTYIHKKPCGGIIEHRRCSRCKKKWSSLGYIFATDIRPAKDLPRVKSRPIVIKRGSTDYAKWADKLPGVSVLASRLPKIKRQYRILAVAVFVLLVIAVVIWLRVK